METLHRYEYDILLVTVGHKDGLYVFGFLIIAFGFFSFDPKCKGKFRGLKQHFQSKMIKFHRISRTGKAVQGLSSCIIKYGTFAYQRAKDSFIKSLATCFCFCRICNTPNLII